MPVICARPGCGEVATTRLFFDSASATVMLDPKVSEWGSSGVLCTRHADRLTIPKGWTLDDRRISAPRLFPVSRFEEPSRLLGGSIARARQLFAPVAQDSTPLPLDGGPAYELPARYEAVTVHPDQTMFELPDQRTPLLARAFESAGSRVRSTSSLSTLIPASALPNDVAAG